jgi:4-hydroxybenzoate polyprenyltransferase
MRSLDSLPLLFAKFVKIEHSVFALPFAYAGALLAEHKIPRFTCLFWITIVMVSARSLAMGLNRIIDYEIDQRNPRTAGRELPAGKLSLDQAIAFVLYHWR